MTMVVSPRLVLVLVLGAVVLCEASPARFFNPSARNSATYDNVVTVDCSNREAVKFVSRTHSNFRCVYPNRNTHRSSVVRSPNSAPLLFSNSVGGCPPGQVFDRAQRKCFSASSSSPFPRGLQSASQVREVNSRSACPLGTVYVSEVDMCLEAQKPRHTAPLQSGSLVVDEPKLEIEAFSSDVQFPSDCKSSEIYNSELSICMTANPPKNIKPLSTLNLLKEKDQPLEIQSFSASRECRNGELFVPEIGTCVSIRPPLPLQSASLVRSVSYFDQKLDTPKDCASNEVFVSEIGLCQPVNPPKVKKPLVSDNQVKEVHTATAVSSPTTCNTGEVFVSEIGICQPARRPQTQKAPSSSSLVKEPVKLEIQSFQTSKDINDCAPGDIFVPEISSCVTP